MRGSCCSRVRICGMRWCCDPADPKWPSDVPHSTAQQWCGVKGSKLRVPVVWSRERERKKGKERRWHLASPRWGKVPWLWHHLCLRKQLGVQRAQGDYKPVGTRLGRGAEATPARRDFQPASPATHFPSAFPWPCLNSLLSPRPCFLAGTGKPSCHKSPVRISLTQERLCSPNCLQPPVVHWN